MKDKIHLAWITTILGIAFLITLLIIMITFHDWSYTLKFEMDNNTLEAVKAINWSAIPK